MVSVVECASIIVVRSLLRIEIIDPPARVRHKHTREDSPSGLLVVWILNHSQVVENLAVRILIALVACRVPKGLPAQ